MDKQIDDNRDLYLNGQTSDVMLSIGNTEIPTHKSVLMKQSEYFNAMFNIEMIEHNLKEVRLEEEEEDGEALISNPEKQFLFVLRIAYGFRVNDPELKALDFSELFDSIIISNKYRFKKVEEIISELFFDKLNAHSSEILYVRSAYCRKADSYVNKENKPVNCSDQDRENLSSIYEVLNISKSFNLDYFPEMCQSFIERRTAQMINSYKYYFNLWC